MDITDDFIFRFVYHGRLVFGIFRKAFAVYTLHGGAVVVHGDAFEGLTSAHDASGAVWGGTVPIHITFADAYK